MSLRAHRRGRHHLIRRLRYGSLGLAALLSACTAQPRLLGDSACAQRLLAFEEQAESASVFLSEPRAVPAFPAVASSRFLASFDPQALTEAQREDWWQRLLAAGARRRSLLADMQNAQVGHGVVAEKEQAALARCARDEVKALPRGDASWGRLSAALQVSDDYSLWRRTLGLYPLSSLGARGGVRSLQKELRHSYTLAPADIPLAGEPGVYLPRSLPAEAAVTERPQRLPHDSLGALVPEEPVLAALLQQHAPVWHVDQQGDYDQPGRPFFYDDDRPRVNSARPAVFAYASLTRVNAVAHLQLNYLLWFDARPRQGVFDTLGGRLDGLLWRVTLDADGAVLLYDSVHACGCYHLFFPGPRLQPRPDTRDWPEPPLVMQAAPVLATGERPLLWVSSQAHYLQGLSVSRADTPDAGGDLYVLSDYEELYFVDHPAGARSLFDRHGLVPGTERAERLYLWPMGIRSPGAMRERGRHATAFIGRRHFDDADLVEQIFRVMP